MSPPLSPRRILLACTELAEPVLRAMLDPLGVDLVAAFTHEQAVERVREGVDLVVCSLRFDESRMLDLVGEIAATNPPLPYMCCRVLASDLPQTSLRAAFIAAGHLGAVAAIDFPALERSLGVGRAEREVRATVAAHLQDAEHASMS
jgi:DNA-binding NtrC family response regulator